jgi:uncharacterized membrane protein
MDSDSKAGSQSNRVEAGFQPIDRLKAFSDGVFAIVITLLVLELTVPPAGVPVLPALAEIWPEFLAYAISFAFVGGIWLSHSGLTQYLKQGDDISFRLNLVLLLFVSLLPFSTRLMISHIRAEDVRGAVTVYGVNLLLAQAMITALLYYATRNRQLLVDVVDDELIATAYRHRRLYLIVSALLIVAGLIIPIAALILYSALTVAFIVQPLFRSRRKSEPK